MCVASQYKMEFTAKQWEEIESMGFDGFSRRRTRLSVVSSG